METSVIEYFVIISMILVFLGFESLGDGPSDLIGLILLCSVEVNWVGILR